ncbi:hypothetical protein MEDNBIBF_00043 [Escherichia phage SR02]|uniref:Uncharacterized protein n=1 Tax=Escherichia phage SR02 TaxID=3056226 RepID=A0AA50F0C3_9CAUD|nr:hypothetical protein MEDNBIBF_00043 [Escherichia phage SR02]
MKVKRANAPIPKKVRIDQTKPGEVVRFIDSEKLYLVSKLTNLASISVNDPLMPQLVYITNLDTGNVIDLRPDTQVVRVKAECEYIEDV